MSPGERRTSSGATAPQLPARWTLPIAVAASGLVALAVSTQIYLSMLDHGHSFGRIAVWQLGGWGVLALASPLVLREGARLVEGWRRGSARVAAIGAAVLAVHVVIAAALTVWLQPYLPVETTGFRAALVGQTRSLPVGVLAIALQVLIGYAAAVYHRARVLELRESRLEADLARSQLEALRLEIQPHFLFNTLNGIASLIRSRSTDRALSMLLGLSGLLRDTLEGAPHHLTTFAAEVGFVRQYIELQRMRFGDRLAVDCDVSPDAETCTVPAFMLQPIVENAFRHGIARRAGPCRLVLAASIDRDELHVRVQDDGAGLPAGFTLETAAGTGLRNIRMRLHRLYGDGAAITIDPAVDGGTIVHLRIPARDTLPQSQAV